jgi:ribosome recycling factor
VSRAEKELESTTSTYVAKIDDMVKAKETELLDI